MKNYYRFLIPGLLFLLSCCSSDKKEITSLSMLEGGKAFAVPTGTAADKFVLKRFPDAQLKYFNSVLDCALAVKEGKADAAIYDKPVLQNIAAKNDGITVLSELLVDDKYGFAVTLENNDLKAAMDGTLAELKTNGIYGDMQKRWFPEKGNPAPMPIIELSGSDEVLRFGTAAVTEPMSFIDGNLKIVGFDVEFATYVAKRLGKRIEVIDMEFGALLPALISGKVDMVGAGLSITEERAKKVLFSESYYPSGIAAAVKSKTKAENASSTVKLRGIDDIKDKRIGVLLGSIHDAYATKNYPEAKIMEFQNVSDMLMALKTEKIDVEFFDQTSLKEVFSTNKELDILAKDIFTVPIAAGISKQNDQLRNQFNSFLKEIKSNGVYDDMVDRWMTKSTQEMPVMPKSNVNGELKVGIVSDLGMPFTIVKDGSLAGFDVELSSRFAASIGKTFVPVDLQFGSMLASLLTNKIDLITCSLMITEERKKQINFSDPYYESGVSVVALKKNLEPESSRKMASIDDLADKRIGVLAGTVHDAFMSKKYPGAKILLYPNTADMILALSADKLDASMFDLTKANLLLRSKPELGILTDQVLSMPLGVGFNKKRPLLRDEFNNYLKNIRADGTYKEMYKRWFTEDPEKAVMPSFKNAANGKKLVVGISVDDLPYIAYKNGDYVGFDIEMVRLFAERGGYNLEFISMEFSSLIAALASEKVDLITDGMAISAERAKQIDFSDSYVDFRTAVVAAKKNLAKYSQEKAKKAELTFLAKFSDSFYSNLIREKRYLLIFEGLKATLLISFFAALVGTILGGLVCFMRMSKRKIVSAAAGLYISLLRGTPVLVLLMIIYYVVFASVNINPLFVAMFAFGLNFAAYVSEMFRTSIESIDKGQHEAGVAGGFTKIQTFIYIIMPQALRQVLPVYKGEFISLVKMTSIVGYIAVQDLTKASDIIRSRTFDAFFPLLVAAVLYLLISWLLTWALGYVEVSVDPKRKRIQREVEVNQ